MNKSEIEKEQQRRKNKLFAPKRLSLIESIQKKLKEMEKPYMGVGNFEDNSYNSALADINNYLEQLK